MFIGLSVSAWAQNTTDKKGILYFHEVSGSFNLNTNGWSVQTDIAQVKNGGKKVFYEFELRQLKNPKEVKQTFNPSITLNNWPTPKPFIYGKQNVLFTLSAIAGSQINLGRKADKSGVAVDLKYSAGLSLGILKPYSLLLLYSNDNQTFTELHNEIYSESNAEKFLDWYSIYGGGGFAAGINHTRFIPGAIVKAGLNFDWAQYDEFIKALEIGISVNGFPKKVPVMLDQQNQQFYPSLYASIQLGKRW